MLSNQGDRCAHFGLVDWRTTEQMFVVQFDATDGRYPEKIVLLVQIRLRKARHKITDRDISIHQLRLQLCEALILGRPKIAKDLAVRRCDRCC